MGGNAAEAHPCGFKWVTEAKHSRGAKLIVVDPRFTRSASVADFYAPIRQGSDIAFLNGVINQCILNDKVQWDYVKAFTNATYVVKEGFEYKDGLFTGYDEQKRDYNKSTWDYELGDDGYVKSDIDHPRSVWNLLKKHVSIYTPEMVERICGVVLEKGCVYIARLQERLSLPQGLIALVVIVLVVSANLISVKIFGEMEFWFALIKVAALVIFLIAGICFVIFGSPTGSETGFHLMSDHGGIFPAGGMATLMIVQGVVFAYAGIELVGTTSGETRDAERIIPKAINTVILRIAVFYVGSVLLLCLLLPYTAFKKGESPFVTFFSSIGVGAAGPIMELVVITAALSSLNAGIYSTGRILHSMSHAGSAPKFAAMMTKSGVPFGGILLTAAVALLGVVLNYFVPSDAFEIVLNLSALGTIAAWATISLSHQKFVSLTRKGLYSRPSYRAPLAPYTNWLTLVFLAVVIVLIAVDYPVVTLTLGSFLVIVVPLLFIGWFAVRGRVAQIAAELAVHPSTIGRWFTAADADHPETDENTQEDPS